MDKKTVFIVIGAIAVTLILANQLRKLPLVKSLPSV